MRFNASQSAGSAQESIGQAVKVIGSTCRSIWGELAQLPRSSEVLTAPGAEVPSTFIAMLDSCAGHAIAPITQIFQLSRANDALEKYTAALALDGSRQFRVSHKGIRPADVLGTIVQ